MISKELLSEVLRDFFNHDNIEWIDKIECADNDIDIFYLYEYLDNYGTDGMCDRSSKTGKCIINIYELAHKCKEWAYLKGYTLASYQSGKNWYVCRDPHKSNPYVGEVTEPEAIFKACEWILKDKK